MFPSVLQFSAGDCGGSSALPASLQLKVCFCMEGRSGGLYLEGHVLSSYLERYKAILFFLKVFAPGPECQPLRVCRYWENTGMRNVH